MKCFWMGLFSVGLLLTGTSWCLAQGAINPGQLTDLKDGKYVGKTDKLVHRIAETMTSGSTSANKTRIIKVTSEHFEPILRIENDKGEVLMGAAAAPGSKEVSLRFTSGKDPYKTIVTFPGGTNFTQPGNYAYRYEDVNNEANPDTVNKFAERHMLNDKFPNRTYELKLRTGTSAVYNLEVTSKVAIRLRVEDTKGKVIAESKQGAGNSLRFTVPSADSYRITVTRENDSGKGAFTLNLKESLLR